MDKILCEGCSAPLRLGGETCENCRRPWSEEEIERAKANAVEAHRRRKRLPVVLAGWLLVAACAAGLYARRAALLGLAATAKEDLVRELDARAKPEPGKPLSPMAQQLITALRVPRGVEKTVTVLAVAESPLVKSAGPRLARRPPTPKAPPARLGKVTRLYGVVYDMNTVSPVGGASLVFRAPGGMTWSASTDEDGYYVVDVPTKVVDKVGIEASVSAEGYREGQIEDVDPPYLERTEEQRLTALSLLSPSDLEPFTVRARPASRLVALDVVLVPLGRAAQ